jgi:hypothetical protein
MDSLDKLFGANDSDLKDIIKANMLMEDELNDDEDIKELQYLKDRALHNLKKQNQRIIADLKSRNFLTLDSSGNYVPYIYGNPTH